MTRGRMLLLALAMAAGCKSARTEILLEIDSDLQRGSEVDQVHVVIRNEAGAERLDQLYDVTPDKLAFPISLALLPDEDKTIGFRVVATALKSNAPVVARAATTSFVEGKTLVLRLELLSRCRTVVCVAPLTCGPNGACIEEAITPGTLPRYGQDAAPAVDASTDSPVDQATGGGGSGAGGTGGAGSGGSAGSLGSGGSGSGGSGAGGSGSGGKGSGGSGSGGTGAGGSGSGGKGSGGSGSGGTGAGGSGSGGSGSGGSTPGWTSAGTTSVGHTAHTATLLGNGNVLVVGGGDSLAATSVAEIYVTATGQWSSGGTMTTARFNHTATRLGDGRVLVAGGCLGSGWLKTVEIYDPTKNTWSAAKEMLNSRCWHTATLLSNGKVLVAGGRDSTNVVPLASAELYDPTTDTWTATGSMNEGRHAHTATLLSSGKVMVVGGRDEYNMIGSSEIYDPASGAWGSGPSMTMLRTHHAAVLLKDGKVVVFSGLGRHPSESFTAIAPIDSAELYDGTSWTVIIGMMRRYNLTATLLANGKVLTAGGYYSGVRDVTELFDLPTLDRTKPLPTSYPLLTARHDHTATLLDNGKVLVVGGTGDAGAVKSAELYTPAP